MSDKKIIPDYLKKSKTTIGGGLGISDDEFRTTPKIGFTVEKGKSKLNIDAQKPISKVDKRNISSTISVGFTKGNIEEGDTSEFSLMGSKSGKTKTGEIIFKKVLGKKPKKVSGLKKGRMFTAAEVRALDEAKSAKNYKKKDRIKSSGDKERIELMGTNLKKFTDGGMCRGAGAAIKGTKFKGVF